ncbi:MAG TPA: M28 family peptidase [Bacteroidales bacterium]|mgnify:CR=1 FL=1|nr:M28 family peptidase [Bacteroidales bacterium]HOK75355.1 M28 family peptidase [Bacteroidales bacterium]HOM39280.1 M28 family peptidase [Bacteroidales bacterium]HPP92920.1 M28 family peptidase [Bacteroidales bacterium]HRR17284.1 M28 family peptidase [Bacteroidales bacterium]
MNKLFISLCAVLLISSTSSAQNSVPRSLLPGKIVSEFIGEASGERAMNHIIEMAGYIHDRPASEYTGYFFETEYIVSKLKEYGLEDVVVNKYPGGTTWDGVRATLWEVSPGISKLADYQELPAVLASGSSNADVTAELVWVGEGRQEDIEKAGVSGKIVVTSGSIAMVNALASAKGALGVISFNSPRPSEVPLAIPITGIGSRRGSEGSGTFGFFLPPREGEILRSRLLAREKITVHAVVEVQNLPYELEVPSCIIKGTDPAAGEVIFSAHLFEGFVKMGANDNISGSAAILEIARMLNTMINEGRIERPRRTIRFIWVPEFSGTGPWVNENKELMQKTLCNINLDMVGLWLKKSNSFLCLHRTTFGNPHYINDVMENYFHFVGLGNREGLAISPDREGFIRRIVAPTGSDDPFYYAIDDHYGASDHEVFNDWGVQVPGVMMITWPDLYYHTSQDVADKCDPTQLKRVCFIGAAAAYTVASAGEETAMKIAADVAGNSQARIGKQLQRAIDQLDKAKSDNFENLYKLTKSYIEAAIINEKATIETVQELAPSSATLKAGIAKLIASVDAAGKATLAIFDSYAGTKALSLGIASTSFKPTETETRAKTIVPKPTPLVTQNGYRGYSQIISKLDPSIREKYPIKGRFLDAQELCRLCNGRNSALDIKKLLDAQMKSGEVELQDVLNYIYILKEAGLVTL